MNRMPLPATGDSAETIFRRMDALRKNDKDWRRGRVPVWFYRASDEVDRVAHDAYMTFIDENALGTRSGFPSLRQMEVEIVDMGLDILSAPDAAVGSMTSGGTESIILAVLSCRDRSRASRGRRDWRANAVVPNTAHPAFDKAGRLLDIAIRRVRVDADGRADVAAMERAIDDDTILLVGSAPCFPYGVIDPIRPLGEVASSRGLWLHVDACVGGYLIPFAQQAGFATPDFDFRVPGVTSISADLHKFGYTPKPASTVFFVDDEVGKHRIFDLDVWPRGRFTTPTINGSRPGGAIAAAWATMRFLGRSGYIRAAQDTMTLARRYREGIAAIPGFEIVGQPDLAILAVRHPDADMLRVAELLDEKGWLPSMISDPVALHFTLSPIHAQATEDYLHDLAQAIEQIKRQPSKASKTEINY